MIKGREEKIRKAITSIFVSAFILIMCILSFMNLMKTYINDEKINNEYNSDESSRFEYDFVGTLLGKDLFVDANGMFRRIIGQDEMNGVVRLQNGHLAELVTQPDDGGAEEIAQELKRVSDIMHYRDRDFIFVATPYQVSKYDKQLPIGYVEYGNDTEDMLLERLTELDVDTVDIRSRWHDIGLNQYDLFYATDHHWNAAGGFWAVNAITDYLGETKGVIFDPIVKDYNSYERTIYPKWYLGSAGKRCGKLFGGIDDFDLLLPLFDTDVTVYGLENQHFDFAEAVYVTDALKEKDYSSDPYSAVFGASQGHYINNNAANDKKVLVVSDSMGKAVMPFMILNFKESMCVGASYATNELIEDYNPDIIMVMAHPGRIKHSDLEYFTFDGVW